MCPRDHPIDKQHLNGEEKAHLFLASIGGTPLHGHLERFSEDFSAFLP